MQCAKGIVIWHMAAVVCTCAADIVDLTASALVASIWLDSESRFSIFVKCVRANGESPKGMGLWRGECVAELL